MKKKFLTRLTSVMLSVILILGTANQLAFAETKPPKEPNQAFITKSQALAFKVLKQLQKEVGNKNIIFSPLSIQYMLGILNNGADAKTQQSINALWGFKKSSSIAALNDQLVLEMQVIDYNNPPDNDPPKPKPTVKPAPAISPNNANGEDEPEDEGEEMAELSKYSVARLNIANATYVKNGLVINAKFRAALEKFKAQAETLDFTNPLAINTINQWTKEHTRGQITTIIDRFENPADIYMILLNAVSFEGRWKSSFDSNTLNKKFYGKDKTTIVNMMQNSYSETYYLDNIIQYSELPIKWRYNMFIILPKSKGKNALDDVIKQLDGTYFEKIQQYIKKDKIKYEGNINLPKFKTEFTASDLKKSFKAIGLDLNYPDATFNEMLKNPKIDVALSLMIHKATIEVEEKGVKASAVTAAVPVVGYSPPLVPPTKFTLNVDRPFIYGIKDNNGMIIFLGTVFNLPDIK